MEQSIQNFNTLRSHADGAVTLLENPEGLEMKNFRYKLFRGGMYIDGSDYLADAERKFEQLAREWDEDHKEADLYRKRKALFIAKGTEHSEEGGEYVVDFYITRADSEEEAVEMSGFEPFEQCWHTHDCCGCPCNSTIEATEIQNRDGLYYVTHSYGFNY